MPYVDGYVLPIPTKNLAAYRRLAKIASKVWRDHGALDYRECAADDTNVMCGIPFPKQLKCKRGETVVFAYIVFKNKAARNRVNAKAMADPRLSASCDPNNMPFDPSRMLTGGFTVLV